MTEEVEKLIEQKEEEKKLLFKSFRQIFEEIADKIYEVEVPELGCTIKYGKLSLADWIEIQPIQDLNESERVSLAKMWSKGDSTVDAEAIKKLPFDVVRLILDKIYAKTPFLHLSKPNNLPKPISSQASTPSSATTLDTP